MLACDENEVVVCKIEFEPTNSFVGRYQKNISLINSGCSRKKSSVEMELASR